MKYISGICLNNINGSVPFSSKNESSFDELVDFEFNSVKAERQKTCRICTMCYCGNVTRTTRVVCKRLTMKLRDEPL